jgi:hypothetical protein
MFNTFFKGSVDDLLNKVTTAPPEAINKVGNKDELLNREELIATVMDDFKMPRAEAERIVTEIQMEELDRIAKKMVSDGLLEISEYDNDGNPKYIPTPLGLSLLK